MIADFHAPGYDFLSNFYLVPVQYEGLKYPSVEHAYQAAKTTDVELRQGFLRLKHPASAKRVGKVLPLRVGWKDMKIGIMRQLLESKFSLQNNDLCRRLVNTGTHTLIEGNYRHDTFWGACHCEVHDGAGNNILGVLLMNRRRELLLTISNANQGPSS